jgi:hypothetical protein
LYSSIFGKENSQKNWNYNCIRHVQPAFMDGVKTCRIKCQTCSFRMNKIPKFLSSKSFIKVQNLHVRDINPDDGGQQISRMPVLSHPEADSPTAFQGMDNYTDVLINSIKQAPS